MGSQDQSGPVLLFVVCETISLGTPITMVCKQNKNGCLELPKLMVYFSYPGGVTQKLWWKFKQLLVQSPVSSSYQREHLTKRKPLAFLPPQLSFCCIMAVDMTFPFITEGKCWQCLLCQQRETHSQRVFHHETAVKKPHAIWQISGEMTHH